MGKFDDLYTDKYDMTDEKKLGLEINSDGLAKKGGALSAVGLILQIAGAAAGFVSVLICSATDGADMLVFDSIRGRPLPPEPYGTAALAALAAIVLGTLLALTGRLARGRKLSAVAAVIFGVIAAGVSAFFSSGFYADTAMPFVHYTVEDGGDCDILYADNTVVHICQVYLIHEDKAYHIEGCSSKGGIQRKYTADYNSSVFLPAYDVAITGDGGFRYELVYTYDENEYFGDDAE